MLLARVIGNVVATQKNQRYEGTRAMLCRQVTPEGADMDYTCIALDSVGSGEGDTVIIDNWRMLHGRPAVPEGRRDRHLQRVYLRSLN